MSKTNQDVITMTSEATYAEKTVDFPASSLAERTMLGTEEAKRLANAIAEASADFNKISPNGLKINLGNIEKPIAEDFIGKKETTLNVSVAKLGSSDDLSPKIDVTPENIDRLIAAINDATIEGQKAKATILKNSGATEISERDMIQVEAAMKNTLKKELSIH